MSLEISHLVVNGCSFTFCQGLQKPHIQGWPALLADKLGVPVVNLSVGGSSNDSIHRRTYEYFFKSTKFNSKPLYILAFSHATRREEFFKKDEKQSYILDLEASAKDFVMSLDLNSVPDYVENPYIYRLSFRACEVKKFLLWNSLIQLLKNNKIPYLTCDFLPSNDAQLDNYMREKFCELYDFALSDKAYAGKINELTDKIPKLPCLHDSLEAMPVIADHLYNKILSIYGSIKPIKNKFLTLDEYYGDNKVFFNDYERDWFYAKST